MGGAIQIDMFTDTAAQEKEHKLQQAMLSIKGKYGKNAVLRGTSYMDGATAIERNGTIGGHKAGDEGPLLSKEKKHEQGRDNQEIQ